MDQMKTAMQSCGTKHHLWLAVAAGFTWACLHMAAVGTGTGSASRLVSIGGFGQRLRRLPLHNITAVCNAQSFRKSDRKCPDDYNHPFSGCLSDIYEADTIDSLLGGEPVSNLRCGFMTSESQTWLDIINRRFARCSYVVYTAAFSYGPLPSTDSVVDRQPGVCFVAFVDNTTSAQHNATQARRWKIIEMESTMLAPTVARSSHMLRALAPRLFPNARWSIYHDIKVKVPDDPLAIMHRLEDSELPVLVVTSKHFDPKRDIFREILATFGHLAKRRMDSVLSPNSTDPVRDSFVKGITGRDFHDMFRQYMFYNRIGYPMHHTGMLDSSILVWNHQNPCTAAFACLWHNQIAFYSMRDQLSFNYVASALGLTEQVHFQHNFSFDAQGANSLETPHAWPRWGDFEADKYWGSF